MQAVSGILAIDQSSTQLGFAYGRDGRGIVAWPFHARSDDWLTRMQLIAGHVRTRVAQFPTPDVIVTEAVSLGIPGKSNVRNLVVMAETRGYLKAVLLATFPDCRAVLDIPHGTIKSFLGVSVKQKRDVTKAAARERATALLQRDDLTEDECDAVVLLLIAQQSALVESIRERSPTR